MKSFLYVLIVLGLVLACFGFFGSPRKPPLAHVPAPVAVPETNIPLPRAPVAQLQLYKRDRFFKYYIDFRIMNAHCKHHGYDESERIEQYFREKIALADAVLARSDTPAELRVLFHDALEKAKNMRIEEAEYEAEATRSRYHQIEDVHSFCELLPRMVARDLQEMRDGVAFARDLSHSLR
ncbi:hypothetical protein [Pseudomonas mangrovi]|uniref:Uncharacterized protein n=1 Tax=Pseudomonas mangrovi TaxID=2161748 RepID=A0A2T5P7N6_9PSED|nr:hypothetical protein [Pseudomonas mangrovi]PTU73769.1 hypothetical protein DBO85_15825 [Pseudomonas mangrovi]